MTPVLTLEPFTTPDIDRLISWIPDAATLLQWAGPGLSWPLTRPQFERDLASLKPNGPHVMLKAKNSSGEVVGHVEIKAIDRTHSNAMLGRIMVSPTHRGQALALPLVNAALQICFADLALHRVGLRVFSHNAPAIACYKRAGFTIEGNERHTKRAPDGSWWDSCTMAILEEEWRSLK